MINLNLLGTVLDLLAVFCAFFEEAFLYTRIILDIRLIEDVNILRGTPSTETL